jgi:two-component system, NtrC family, sensor histidine kinase HydH
MMAAFFLFLLFCSVTVIYTTAQNASSVQTLANTALESTALALSSSAENVLHESRNSPGDEIREIFSDRVVAYALIAGKDGKILFHTNSRLIGSSLSDSSLDERLQSGSSTGRRVTLQTGLPAYEFNYILHLPDNDTEMLRLVLNTAPFDLVVSRAHRMWWFVGIILAFLWTAGIFFSLMSARYFRLQKEMEQRKQMALIGQMTAVLAHEIRNALGGIKGFTQWIDEKTLGSDPQKKGIVKILQGTSRIETLVNELLLFSRRETYDVKSLNLSRLIDEALLSFVSWEGRVEPDIEPGISVMADREKLYRVLLNGIQNSVEAMENKGTLHISAHNEGRWVKILIEDTGKGVPEKEFVRLFTPFHTTKLNGTGLGLTYSKKVVEGMGGKISLSNRANATGAVLAILLKKGNP